MATYTPRPDGLVDVTTDSGKTLPMGEAQAQAGGATLALGPPGMPTPFAAPGPPPVANPYSALGPNAVAGPGGGDTQMSPDEFRARLQQQPPPPSGSHAPAAEPLVPPSMGRAPARPGADQYAALDIPEPLHPDSPPINSIPSSTGGEASPEGLTRGQGADGGPVLSPQAQYFGQQSPGRIVQTSKGGDVRASYIRKPGEELDPATKAYADSLDPAKMASDRETLITNAAIAHDNATANMISATKDAEAALEEQRQQIAQNRATLQKKLDIVDRREREAATATPQTRREVLQSRGALAGVMSGLSIALGGWVQGLKGGENPGLKIVNDSIESEISSQRAKWEALKDQAAGARTDFGQAMQLYGDPNMAEADMRMRALTLAANMSSAYKSQGENQEWLANQQQVTQQLAGAAAAEKQKWKTLADGQVVQENFVNRPATYAHVGGAPKLDKAQQERADKARPRLVRTPDGRYGYVAGETEKKGVQEQLSAGGDVVDSMAKLLALANDNTITDQEKRARYKALTQDIRPIISVAKKQGAMGEQEVKGYEDILGDPSAIIKDNGAAIRTGIEQQKARNDRIIRDNLFSDPDANVPFAESTASTFKPGIAK